MLVLIELVTFILTDYAKPMVFNLNEEDFNTFVAVNVKINPKIKQVDSILNKLTKTKGLKKEIHHIVKCIRVIKMAK